ncbi:MAG: hypothetical protein KAJ51_09580, partial [Thermoplasmata archaeon]|nr:hypothetical protein [Thermoplasmata archaeon]
QDTIFEYQNIKNNLKLYFNKDYSPDIESNLISIKDKSDQNQLTWQPLRLSIAPKHDSAFEEFWNQGKFDINLLPTQGLAIENMMVYKDIYPGCEDSYIVKPNELKHDLILNEFPDELLNLDVNQQSAQDDPEVPTLFLNYYGILSLPVSIAPYLDGAIQTKAFETSKAIDLNSIVTGKPIYSIKGPIAYEQSNPERRIKCNYEFIPLLDPHSGPTNPWTRTLVVLKTDLNWLKVPSRQYPVILDPDLETPKYDKGEEGFDTYLVRGNETEPEWTDYNFGESTKLKITLAGPSLYSNLHLLHRSILKFPGINIIKSNAQVTSAKLILVCGNYGNMSITVFKLYDDWIEGNGTETTPSKIGATWNNSGFNIWSGGNYDGHVTDRPTVKVERPS